MSPKSVYLLLVTAVWLGRWSRSDRPQLAQARVPASRASRACLVVPVRLVEKAYGELSDAGCIPRPGPFGTPRNKEVSAASDSDLKAMAPRRTLWNSNPGGGRLPATAHTTAAGLVCKACHGRSPSLQEHGVRVESAVAMVLLLEHTRVSDTLPSKLRLADAVDRPTFSWYFEDRCLQPPTTHPRGPRPHRNLWRVDERCRG